METHVGKPIKHCVFPPYNQMFKYASPYDALHGQYIFAQNDLSQFYAFQHNKTVLNAYSLMTFNVKILVSVSFEVICDYCGVLLCSVY